jgi:hypothetical protein
MLLIEHQHHAGVRCEDGGNARDVRREGARFFLCRWLGLSRPALSVRHSVSVSSDLGLLDFGRLLGAQHCLKLQFLLVLHQQGPAVHAERKLHLFAVLILDINEGVRFDKRRHVLVRDVRALVHQAILIARRLNHYRFAIDKPTAVTAFSIAMTFPFTNAAEGDQPRRTCQQLPERPGCRRAAPARPDLLLWGRS